MLQLLALALGAAIIYRLFTNYQKFTKNLAEAKQSGIPYIWTPIYVRFCESPMRVVFANHAADLQSILADYPPIVAPILQGLAGFMEGALDPLPDPGVLVE